MDNPNTLDCCVLFGEADRQAIQQQVLANP